MVPAPSNIPFSTHLCICIFKFINLHRGGAVFWMKSDPGSESFILNPQLSLRLLKTPLNELWRHRLERLYFRKDNGLSQRKPLWGVQVQKPEVLTVGLSVTALNWNCSSHFHMYNPCLHGLAMVPAAWVWVCLLSGINYLDLVTLWRSWYKLRGKWAKGSCH